MKKNIKKTTLFFAMFLLTVATVFANDPYFKLEKDNKKSLNLRIEKINEPVSVSFKNKKGIMIYSEVFNIPTIKKFNLKEMEVGTYYMEINTGEARETYLIEINNNTFELNKELSVAFHNPFIAVNDSYILVTKLNISKRDMKIFVYDEDENLLYAGIIDGKNENQTIGQKFNTANIKKGTYTFHISTDRKTYTKKLRL